MSRLFGQLLQLTAHHRAGLQQTVGRLFAQSVIQRLGVTHRYLGQLVRVALDRVFYI